jgi:enoyl-CoA hydratase
MERAMVLASKIASQAPVAVACAKSAINNGINTDIDSACAIENDAFSKCFDTQDQKNVMDAFLKKEKFTKFENK